VPTRLTPSSLKSTNKLTRNLRAETRVREQLTSPRSVRHYCVPNALLATVRTLTDIRCGWRSVRDCTTGLCYKRWYSLQQEAQLWFWRVQSIYSTDLHKVHFIPHTVLPFRKTRQLMRGLHYIYVENRTENSKHTHTVVDGRNVRGLWPIDDVFQKKDIAFQCGCVCACLLIRSITFVVFCLVTAVPCYELNTQKTATSGKWYMQKQNPTFLTAPVCFLSNISPEIMSYPRCQNQSCSCQSRTVHCVKKRKLLKWNMTLNYTRISAHLTENSLFQIHSSVHALTEITAVHCTRNTKHTKIHSFIVKPGCTYTTLL